MIRLRHRYIVLYTQHYDSHNIPMIPIQTIIYVTSNATNLLCLKSIDRILIYT